MHEVTCRLVELLELDITRQRLDSTHVFCNMASFGRTRLLGVTVKRFLTQVKRHAPEAYDALPEPLRTRYATSVGKLSLKKPAFSRARGSRKNFAQSAQVAHNLPLPNRGSCSDSSLSTARALAEWALGRGCLLRPAPPEPRWFGLRPNQLVK